MNTKVKLIITADDYGINPAVNEGIKIGIEKGVINTISVMMNFKSSKDDLRSLFQFLIDTNKYKKVGIGVHLNFSVGTPILKKDIDSIVYKRQGLYRFYTFSEIAGFDKSDFRPKEIGRELIAQIETYLQVVSEFKEYKEFFAIDHFTSQHNLLSSVPHFSKVLAKLSKLFKKNGKNKHNPIPVRRTMPLFKELRKREGGNKKENKKLKEKLDILKGDTVDYIVGKHVRFSILSYLKYTNYKNLASRQEFFESLNIETPDLMFFSFYATPKKRLKDKLKNFRRYLPALRKAAVNKKIIKKNEVLYIEIIHHLGIKTNKELRKAARKVSGFDMYYFVKYRQLELKLIESNLYQKLLAVDGIEHGSYSELNSQVLA